MKLIFPGTSQRRCNEVAALINKYADKFEINTPLRLAHFIGQIGVETGGLLDLDEKKTYSPRRVVEQFGLVKYADLFEGYNSDPNRCQGVRYESDGGTLGDGKPMPVSPNFPYQNTGEIIQAYAFPTSGVTKSNIKQKVAQSYNEGKLRVKSRYYGRDAKLFDVTYSCRMGNRGPGSGDGSTFAGKGFIHLTGRWEYKQISVLWNQDPDNADNPKEFHGQDIAELTTNLDVAMKASMYYWKRKGLNNITDKGISEANINTLGSKVNGKYPPEAAKERIKKTNTAYDTLTKDNKNKINSNSTTH